MEQITRGVAVRVGVDLAKRVIQVHAVDSVGGRSNLGSITKRGDTYLRTLLEVRARNELDAGLKTGRMKKLPCTT